MSRHGMEADSAESSDNPSSSEEVDWIDTDKFEGSDDENFPGVHPVFTAFNLAKCMIGEGMLSLAAGLGASTGLGVGLIICVCFAVFMAYTFSMLGRVCHATGSKNLTACCEALDRPCLGRFMSASIVLLTFMGCWAFCIILADNVSEIFKGVGASGWWVSYEFALLLIVIVLEVPLCLIRDMSKLAVTSMIGVAFEIWTVIFLAVRYFDGSYAPGGKYYVLLPEEGLPVPDFGEGISSTSFHTSAGTLVLVCSLATAYIAHFQAPKFYHQLRNKSVARFNVVTTASFGLASVVFICSMLFGYLTFGQHCQGNILQNYSAKDNLADITRAGMTFAVAFGFPIVFTGLRDSTLEVLGLSGARRRVFYTSTFLLLVPIVILASFAKNLGFANGLIGAILGSLTTIAFPAILCYLTYEAEGKTFASRSEGTVVAGVLLLLSAILAVGGTIQVVEKRINA